MKKKLGVIIIGLLLIITTILWILAKGSWLLISLQPPRSFAELVGLYGTILLCIDFIIATKAHFIETLFGGLDKVYKAHHIIGGIAYILIIWHPVLLAINILPSIPLAIQFFLPGGPIGYLFGILSFYAFTFLIIFTFFIRLPYHIWRLIHSLMGIPLLLVALHVFFVQSDTSTSVVLRYWMLGLICIAILCYIYTRFLYTNFGSKYPYELDQISIISDIIEIYARPLGKRMYFIPGQFTFIAFPHSVVGAEKHPFSLSLSPEDAIVRLTVKASGDYTSKLKQMPSHGTINLYGPYGSFGDKFLIGKKDEIWIGGGIGIAPFLSMLYFKIKYMPQKKVWLFYVYNTDEDGYYREELRSVSTNQDNVVYIECQSKVDGHLTPKKVEEIVERLDNKVIFICGPKRMMVDFYKNFVRMGVKPYDVIFEDFSFGS